jgi:hypothetical protein
MSIYEVSDVESDDFNLSDWVVPADECDVLRAQVRELATAIDRAIVPDEFDAMQARVRAGEFGPVDCDDSTDPWF